MAWEGMVVKLEWHVAAPACDIITRLPTHNIMYLYKCESLLDTSHIEKMSSGGPSSYQNVCRIKVV